MRKITITASALMAIAGLQITSAATINVDFSKATGDVTGATPIVLDGFSFVGNYKDSKLDKNGFYTGGGSSSTKKHIYFTPSKNGTLTVKGKSTADDDRYIFVATTPGGDASASDVMAKVSIPKKGVAKTVSVDLIAGTTYYVCLQGNGMITSLSFVESELPSADASQELTIKKGTNIVDVELTLNVGTYEFKADGYTILVDGKEGTTATVSENGKKVKVTIKASANVEKDTKVAFSYSISGKDLQAVKTVYANKIAVVINKANVYTDDARLQEDATKASALMAKANNIGMTEYNEYVTTGKIAALDKEISELSADITAHKAVYDGHKYAQEAYGNKYVNGEWKATDPATGLLADLADLTETYNADKNAAVKEAAKEIYDNAVKQVSEFLTTIQSEYAAGTNIDVDTYKATIDSRVENVKSTIASAKSAIENGGSNALSHSNIVGQIEKARGKYNTVANNLYNALVAPKDGETYNDMYVAALKDLNAYMRTIKEVETLNEQYYKDKKCTKETVAELNAKLASILGDAATIGNVYTEYNDKATTLRANYAAANADIKNNLTGYLKSQIKNFIGSRKEVNTQFDAKIKEIESSIAGVQAQVDEVNKAHTIAAAEFYAGYGAKKTEIRKAIDNLKGSADAAGSNVAKAVAEYDAWQAALKTVDNLQTTYTNTKKTVTARVSADKAYNQETKFAVEYEAVIQKSINDLKTSANASFKADGTGTARTFNGGLASKVATVKKSINDYSDASKQTLAKYNEIATAITSYKNALNGYDVKDKDGKVTSHVDGLKEVATNTDVTINATEFPTTGKLDGKTYATVITEIEKQISELQTALTTAAAKNDKEHVTEMGKLKVIDGLVKTIGDYLDTYAANEKAWNAAQLKLAKKSMLDEADRRVAAIDTKNAVQNENYTDEYGTVVDTENANKNKATYEFDTYGKSINDEKVKDKDGKETTVKGLNTLLGECKAQVSDIEKQIIDAKAYGEDKDAEAIALLSKVVDALQSAEKSYADLNKKAEAVKKAYTAEKAERKTLLETIAAKDGIIDQLAKVTYDEPNYFATEVSNMTTEITKAKEQIEASFKAETLRADNKDGKYDKALAAISTKITNLQGLVKNEKNNDADNAAFTKTYNAAKVSDAIAAAQKAIDALVDEEQKPAKTYFQGQLDKFSKEDKAITDAQVAANKAVNKALGTDKKTLPGALDQARYTDVKKNMTAMKASLESRLTANKANIQALAGLIKANESAKATQDGYVKSNDDLRNEVFQIITTTENSSYHETALATLKSIDSDIAKYKEDVATAYAKGTCDTDKTTLNANAESIKTRLTTLKNGWNDEYTKAVAADNQARKENFDNAYKKLTETYSHEVNIVTELSKLSYAQDQSGVLGEVVGEGGIYSYAEKMRELNSNASKAYAATAAPTLFDAAESFKSDAETMEAEILALSKKYADAVNSKAESTYTTQYAAADKALSDAKKEAQSVLGIDAKTADKAFEDVQQDLVSVKVVKDSDGNLPSDFALNLDKIYIPTFNGIAAKIVADKEAAAVASYDARIKEYKALVKTETAAIAGFNGEGEDGELGKYSEAYATFVGNTVNAAETAWGKIKTGEKYANFADVKTLLDNFKNSINTRTISGKQVSQTATYWTAYDENATYHANDIAYADMQKEIAAAQKVIDAANDFVASLIVKNDATVTSNLSTAQSNLDNIQTEAEGYHTGNTAKANLATIKTKCASVIAYVNDITGGQTGVLATEKSQITVQVGFLRHDYNQATAANIEDASIDAYKEVIAGYDTENTKIWKEFTVGKKDAEGNLIVDSKKNPVKATAEETRLAYIALEGKIATTKAELTAKYNEKAAAEAKASVDAEIAALTETYTELIAQLADCHAPVVEKYQPEVDAFKAAIDGLQKELDAEVAANSVLLYKDVNLASAANIAKMVTGLSDDIAKDEKHYDVNDAQYIKLLGQNNKLAESLKKVMDESADYEFKRVVNYEKDFDGDGKKELYVTYRDYQNALINAKIVENKSLIDKSNARFELTEVSTLKYSTGKVNADIDSFEKTLANYNVVNTMPTADDVDDVKAIIETKGYTVADKATLLATADNLIEDINKVGVFNSNVYKGYSTVDINGVEIKNEADRYFFYMEQYPTLIAKAQELRQSLADLAKDADEMSWIKGGVDHNGEVTVADYEAVRQIVLGNTECTEGSAMFYAADVNWDGKINIGDVTLIADNIMTGNKLPADPTKNSKAVSMARAMALGVPTYGTLNVTAEGSGLEQTVKVAVDSELGFVGGQFDVVLPAGVKLAGASSDSHDALMGEVDGTPRVLVSNLANTEITSGATFVELKVEVSSEYKGGAIEVANAQFADAEGNVYTLAKSSINTTTGLTNLTTTEKVQSKIYSVGGMLMNKMKSGLNIIVNSDGTTRKEIKK